MHCAPGQAAGMNPILMEPLLDLAATVETVEMMEAGIVILEVEIVSLEAEIVSWGAEIDAVVVVVGCCAVAKLAGFPLSSRFATQVHVLVGGDPGAEPGTCRQAGRGCTCTGPRGCTCQTA